MFAESGVDFVYILWHNLFPSFIKFASDLCLRVSNFHFFYMFLRTTFLRKRPSFLKNNIITQFKMSSENTPKKPILALPSTADETVSFDINDTYKLKELGPVGK